MGKITMYNSNGDRVTRYLYDSQIDWYCKDYREFGNYIGRERDKYLAEFADIYNGPVNPQADSSYDYYEQMIKAIGPGYFTLFMSIMKGESYADLSRGCM